MSTGSYRGNPSLQIAGMVGTMYVPLRSKCFEANTDNPARFEDTFHDTVLLVIHDSEAHALTGSELFDYFLYRFRMMNYRAVHNEYERRKALYGYGTRTEHKGTEQEDEDGWPVEAARGIGGEKSFDLDP